MVIVGIIGGTGWYVMHSSKQVDKTYSQTGNNTVVPKAKGYTKPTPSPASSSQKYLTIKEWGVRLKLSSTNADSNYKFEKDSDQFVVLSSTKLDEAAKNSKVCSGANESVTLNRTKVGDDHFGSPWTEKELQSIGKKVGDYYYYNDAGQPCFGTDADFAKEPGVMETVAQLRSQLPTYKDVEQAS